MALFSQSDLDAINAAIKSGVLTYQHEGSLQTYRSLDDMIKVRDMIQRDLASISANPRVGPRYSRATFED